MDYFLKAATEAELHAALVEAGILVETLVPVVELQDTGVIQRTLVVSDGDDRKRAIDPDESWIETMLAIGYVIESDATEPVMASVQTGEQPGHSLGNGFCLDTIGQIIKPTGQMLTVDGVEVPEIAPIAGFHANLRGELSEAQLAALAPILLTAPPENPFRVWA